MDKPTIYDLSSDACRHPHEQWWRGRPINLDTAEYVTRCVQECTMARDGLNFCAHTNLHSHNADDIFNNGLSWFPIDEKTFLLTNWKLLSDLKSRVDQLYRYGHGGNLDIVWQKAHDSQYSEDPRYARRALDLAEKDPLRTKLCELQELEKKSDFWERFYILLVEVEDILVARRAFLIFSAQQRIRSLSKK